LVYCNVKTITKDLEGNFWFGTVHGLSKFDGTTWKSYTEPDVLPHQSVNTIAVDHDGVKWFGTGNGVLMMDRGIWKSASGHIITSVYKSEEKSIDFNLCNYPNPFNPFSTISFTPPSSGKASLIIYDILGRKVRELISGQISSGIRSVLWDGRDDSGIAVSSGVYFARLTMGKSLVVRKMLLMK